MLVAPKTAKTTTTTAFFGGGHPIAERTASTESNSSSCRRRRSSNALVPVKALCGVRRGPLPKKRRPRRHNRCAPYRRRKGPGPKTTPPMFKRGYNIVSDAMVNGGQRTAPPSVPSPPAFSMPAQPGFSPFTPEYQQFPYTFSSATPPMYSWANTNSTNVMKFTGSSNPQPLDTSSYRPSNFGSVPKRKIDLDAELPQPPKMLITEEKVSASLRDMHISREFKPHNYCLPNDISEMDTIDDLNLPNIVDGETTKIESQTTLVMCEELRKLHKIDSIIPQPLLKVERPTNAVMVWRPKPVVQLGHSFSDCNESESTVVITEITDEEENEINNQDKMFVEDENCIAVEDDDMEL